VIAEKEVALARRVARKIGSRWSAVEVEDLEQDLVLWLFENTDHVERYRTEEGGESKLYVALKRRASKLCAREQTVRSGAPLDVNSTYSIAQLERAMPFVFEDVPQSVSFENPVTGEASTSGFSGDYGVALAVMTDIRGAFQDLPSEMKLVLQLRFRDGMTYQEIGDLSGMTLNGAKKRVRRALSRMQEILDGVLVSF
jgi:RNA polymerase sigma factor (sigma-70 family)